MIDQEHFCFSTCL